MKNNDFNYAYHYKHWHSDTKESLEHDKKSMQNLLSTHAIYPSKKTDSILEIGCGMGRLLLALQDEGYTNTTGIDIDQSQINVAKKENLDVHLADASDFLSTTKKKYSIIYALDILEHIEKSKQLPLLHKMYEHLNDDGFIVIQVPNALSPTATFFRYVDFTHTVSYTIYSMGFLLNNAGFHWLSIRPQHQESQELQALKMPWARLYRHEFNMHDCILTPNIVAIAFKNEDAFNKWHLIVPPINNTYDETTERPERHKTKKPSYLKKVLVNVLCLFIQNKVKRHKARDILLKF